MSDVDAELRRDIEQLKFQANLQPDQYREDLIRRTIARLEALAVGGERVDEAWMRSVFSPVVSRPHWLASPPNASDRQVAWRADRPNAMYVAIADFRPLHETFDSELLIRRDQLTRRHVVDLCAALGVELRATTTERTP